MNKLVTDIKKFTDRVKLFHSHEVHGHKQEIWGEFKSVIETRGSVGLIQSYLNDKQLPLFFSDKTLVDEIKENNKLTLTEKFDNDKTTIFELCIHPIEPHNLYSAFEGFFTKWKELIPLMQQNKVLCVIWFGWEGDDWCFEYDTKKTHYDLIMDFQRDYEIPAHSMIFLHSNMRGEERENEVYKDESNLPHIWYDYWYEFESFVRRKDSTPLIYSFDDYFDGLKNKMEYKFLRVNRTWNNQRDMLAYSIYKMGYFDECNWELREIRENSLKYDIQIAYEESEGVESLQKILPLFKEVDLDVIKKIQSKLPLISSEEERRLWELKSDHHSNETVPASIYTSAPISYISTSFPDRDSQVFFHMSTFNPIWNYHPILFNGNPYTIREMKRVGFKTFDFLFDEKYDEVWNERERLMHTLIEFEKIVNLPKNKILDLIYDNQDKLIFNREFLLELNSYKRFFEKINNHLDKYYDNK